MFCIIDPDNFTAGIDSLIMPPSFTTLDSSKFLSNGHHERLACMTKLAQELFSPRRRLRVRLARVVVRHGREGGRLLSAVHRRASTSLGTTARHCQCLKFFNSFEGMRSIFGHCLRQFVCTPYCPPSPCIYPKISRASTASPLCPRPQKWHIASYGYVMELDNGHPRLDNMY